MRGCRISSSARFFLIAKDYGPKCGAIQLSSWGKSFRAKLGLDGRPHFRVIFLQIVGGLVGIEQPAPNQLLQVTTETRFAGADSAGDSKNKAGFSHWLVAACNEVAEDGQLICAIKQLPTLFSSFLREVRPMERHYPLYWLGQTSE